VKLFLLLFLLFASPAFAGDREEALRRLELAPGASIEQIKAAYRAAVKRYHPDVVGGEASVEKFTAVQDAYDFLRGKIFKLQIVGKAPPRENKAQAKPQPEPKAEPSPRAEPKPPPEPEKKPEVNSEYKIFAQQCSALYRKTAQLGKGN
jgi:curved DNA-binding protein CbpA